MPCRIVVGVVVSVVRIVVVRVIVRVVRVGAIAKRVVRVAVIARTVHVHVTKDTVAPIRLVVVRAIAATERQEGQSSRQQKGFHYYI